MHTVASLSLETFEPFTTLLIVNGFGVGTPGLGWGGGSFPSSQILISLGTAPPTHVGAEAAGGKGRALPSYTACIVV